MTFALTMVAILSGGVGGAELVRRQCRRMLGARPAIRPVRTLPVVAPTPEPLAAAAPSLASTA